MPRPLRNRFVHLDLEPDLDDWCRWAVKAGVRPEIIAFLRFKPELLHTADATSEANAWPTPRSWEMASNVLSGIANRQKATFLSGASDFEAQLLDGTVGTGCDLRTGGISSGCSVSYRRLTRSCSTRIRLRFHGDLGTDRHRNRAWTRGDDNSIARGLRYLDRMPTEMRVMAVRDAAARDTAITHTPEFVRFGVEYREVLQ